MKRLYEDALRRPQPYQVPDVTLPKVSVPPAVSGTIADVSSSEISDSLRVVIGDLAPPESSHSPSAEVKKSKKGILGGLFGSNRVNKVREWPDYILRSSLVAPPVLSGLELEVIGTHSSSF